MGIQTTPIFEPINNKIPCGGFSVRGAVSNGALDVSPGNCAAIVQTGEEEPGINLMFEHISLFELDKYCVIDEEAQNLYSKAWKENKGYVVSQDNIPYFAYEPVTGYRCVGVTMTPTVKDEIVYTYMKQVVTYLSNSRFPAINFVATKYGNVSIIDDPEEATENKLYLLLSDGTDGIYNKIIDNRK